MKNTFRHVQLILPVSPGAFILLGTVMGLVFATSAADLAWKRSADALALQQDGKVLWQYNYGTNEAKPCFHPVALSGGPELTWYRPGDHRWHRALWFSWKFINGVNYWEEDAKTGLAAGRTEWQPPKITTRADFSARFEMALTYRPANGQPLLTEKRLIEVAPPTADGVQQQDWTLTFTALDKDVVFDRTPLPNEPDGKPYGGYAGLSVRFVKELEQVQAVTTQEAVTFAGGRYRGKATGLDYSGKIGNAEAGIAIIDHPKNLNAPTPWYVINDGPMRYYSPAVICYGPHTLKAGQELTLRYRVLIHPGRWNAERLKQATESYQAPAASTSTK